MGREGFEPPKHLVQQIYSLSPLTTWVPARLLIANSKSLIVWQFAICELQFAQWSRREELNPQPSVYKTLALPLSYVGIICYE